LKGLSTLLIQRCNGILDFFKDNVERNGNLVLVHRFSP